MMIQSTPVHTSRAVAKENLLQTWKQRRAERQPTSREDLSQKRTVNENEQPSSSSTRSAAGDTNDSYHIPALQLPIPNFCSIVQRSWNQLIGGGGRITEDNHSKKNHDNGAADSESKTTTGLHKSNKDSINISPLSSSRPKSRSTFPSVLQMIQAHALMQQVERLRTLDDNNNQTSSSASSSLSILPSGYNYQQAILQLSQSRNRAFFLLDLSLIVQRLVGWKQEFANTNTTNTNKLRFLHSVQANGDDKLLRVLLQSQVGLAVTTTLDIERVLMVLAAEESQRPTASTPIPTTTNHHPNHHNNNMIYPRTLVGPDGFLRDLIWRANTNVVVVDGPDEVARVSTSLQRMARRRGWANVPRINILLQCRHKDPNVWPIILQETMQQVVIQQQASSQLLSWEGISLDINCQHETEWTRRQQVAEQLLAMLVETDPTLQLRVDLTGFSSHPFPKEWISWWQRLETLAYIKEITIDASMALIAPAGALCTRIIGVRETKNDATSGSTSSSSSEQQLDQQSSDRVDPSLRRHYYIDDGCYGSLYQRVSNQCDQSGDSPLDAPMPLQNVPREGDDRVFLSTVWGPTCDGLDRVCRDIVLPSLHRDDWLVFPNLGCSSSQGLGTAFNGFAPPDTAYCVLGYFQK